MYNFNSKYICSYELQEPVWLVGRALHEVEQHQNASTQLLSDGKVTFTSDKIPQIMIIGDKVKKS